MSGVCSSGGADRVRRGLRRLRRIPAAPLQAPLGLGMALQDAGRGGDRIATVAAGDQLHAGRMEHDLGFNRTILAHAARAPPRVVTSILVLIAVCGGLAAILVVGRGSIL